MNCAIFLLSFIPAVLWILFFYYQDRYEKEPLKLLLLAFFWGCVSTIPAILIETVGENLIDYHMPYTPYRILVMMIMVGFTEETCKYFAVKKTVYSHVEFNEPMDGIVYCVTAAMGFAFVENIFYMLASHETSGFIGAFSIGLMRAFFSMFGHATFGVIMGAYLGRAKFTPEKEREIIWKGVILASLIHMLYNFTLSINKECLGGILLLIAFPLVWKNMNRICVDRAEDSSPFKPEGETRVPGRWQWNMANIFSILIIIFVVISGVISFYRPADFVNHRMKYTVTHPSYWSVNQGQAGDLVELSGPSYKNSTPMARIRTRELENAEDTELLMERMLKELAHEKMENLEEISAEDLVVQGRNAKLIKVRWEKTDKEQSDKKQMSYILMIFDGKKITHMTCSVNEKQFDFFEKRFLELIKSLKFND